MGLPVFRAASAKAAGTGAVTPALPAGVAANDIVLLVATTIAGGSLSITANGSISSWTAVTGSPIDVTSGEKLYVWWGRYVSGSTGPTVTPGSDHCCAATLAYSGCLASGTPIEATATGTEATSDTSFSFATGVSTSDVNRIVIGICSTGADSNSSQFSSQANSALASIALRADFCTNSGGGGGFGFIEGALAAAGSCGTFTATLGTATPKAYITFALVPLAPVIASASLTLPLAFTSGGSVPAQGAAAFTLSPGFAADGAALVQAALSQALGLALTSAGAVAVQAGLSQALPLALTAAGTEPVQAAFAQTLALNLAADAGIVVQGVASFALNPSLSADGTVATAGVTADTALALPLALAADGEVAIAAEAPLLLVATLAADASVALAAAASLAVPVSLAATGGVAVAGDAPLVLPLGLAASALIAVQGAASLALAPALSAAAAVGVLADVSLALSPQFTASGGSPVAILDAAFVLPLALEAESAVLVQAGAGLTLTLTPIITALVPVRGDGVALLPFGFAGQGGVLVQADADLALPLRLTATAGGPQRIGDADFTLGLALSAAGRVMVQGRGCRDPLVLAPLIAVAVTVTGDIDPELDLILTADGRVLVQAEASFSLLLNPSHALPGGFARLADTRLGITLPGTTTAAHLASTTTGVTIP